MGTLDIIVNDDDVAPGTVRFVRDGEIVCEAEFFQGLNQGKGGHIEFHSSDRDLMISQVRQGLGLID